MKPGFEIPSGFEIGVTVRHRLTGVEGMIGGYVKREAGHTQVLLVPKGDAKEHYYYDPPLLEIIDSSTKLEGLDAPDLPLEHDIGDQVVDPISSFKGIVISIQLETNGCFYCKLTGKLTKDGEIPTVLIEHRRLKKGTIRNAVAPPADTGARATGSSRMKAERPD
jgi:hypothetical protein